MSRWAGSLGGVGGGEERVAEEEAAEGVESGEAVFAGCDLSSKTRGGAFWLFGFMVQGGFEVQRGFIAEGRVQACSIILNSAVRN